MQEYRIRVWDLPLRMFHWLLVAVIALAFLSSEEDSSLAAWHEPAGWTAAILIAFRIAWGFVGGEHARFGAFLRPGHIAMHLREIATRPKPTLGHNPAGAVAIVLMMGLIVIIVATGAVLDRSHALEEVHELAGYALLGLIAVHVVAVAAMSIVTRENLVRAMITGDKPAAAHPDARNARPPSRLALPIAALAILAAGYGATRVDGDAFRPGARSDGEAGSRPASLAKSEKDGRESD